MTSNQDTINQETQPTMTDYSQLSQAELIALLSQKDSENAELKKNQKKTKRKKSKKEAMPPIVYEDYYFLRKPYFIPAKIPKDDKPAVCEMLSSYGFDETAIKALIKTAKKTTVSLWLAKDYVKGVETQKLFIHAEEWGDFKKLFEGGSSSTFLTEGKVEDFPLEPALEEHPAQHIYDLVRPDDDAEWSAMEWGKDLLAYLLDQDTFVPTAKAIQSQILIASIPKDYKEIIVQDFIFGRTPEVPAYQNTLDGLLLADLDLLKRKTRKNGDLVGTTWSLQTVVEDGVEVVKKVDLCDKENRKFVPYHKETSERCLCLLEKKGKQRCGFKASFKLPSGMMFCSSHAGNILQTNYLLEKQGTPDDTYEHGVRAGWCENNCDAHECECEKTDAVQLKKFKTTYSLLTQEEKAHYKTLKDRNKTNYGELFKDYAM